MSNEIEEKDDIYDSASIEVKEGFFSKLFSSFGRKALPPASGVVKTNASISSLMARGSFRAALVNIGNRIQNVLAPKKEVAPASTLSAHVIGESNKDENSLDQNKSNEEAVLSTEQPRVFIPTAKTATATRSTTVMNNTPAKNLAVEEIEVDSEAIIEAAELEIDDSMLVHEDEKAPVASQGIQAVDMTVENKDPKTKDRTSDIENERDL